MDSQEAYEEENGYWETCSDCGRYSYCIDSMCEDCRDEFNGY